MTKFNLCCIEYKGLYIPYLMPFCACSDNNDEDICDIISPFCCLSDNAYNGYCHFITPCIGVAVTENVSNSNYSLTFCGCITYDNGCMCTIPYKTTFDWINKSIPSSQEMN